MRNLEDYASYALFARVVHHRSFSAAAREAGIAKSAVSRRISALEAGLGVRLLQRSTRTLSITDEGLRVYEHCVALVAAANAVEEAAGSAGPLSTERALTGTLRVNAPVTFAQMYLTPAIVRFLSQQPQLEVQLSTEDRFVDVVEGGFDVVLRIGRLTSSGLIARRLARDRLVVCGAPHYLAQRGTPDSVADLAQHNCLHYGLVDRAAEWRFAGPAGKPTVPPRGNFVASDGTALREAALHGLGLAVLPSFMVAREVAAGRLRLVLEGKRRGEIGIYAVTAHRTHAPPRTRAFLDFLSRHFSRTNWMD